MVTPNLLVALPHTPLYKRLEKATRLNSSEGRDSNIEYRLFVVIHIRVECMLADDLDFAE